MSKLSFDWDKNWEIWKQAIAEQIKEVPCSEYYPMIFKKLSFYKKGSRFLDAGSGLGRWVFYYEKFGFQACGLDISELAIKKTKEYAKQNNLSSKFIYGDLRKIPVKSDSFDFISSFGVIEHFPDSINAVKEFYRILCPGGSCYITTPNIFSFHGLIGYPTLSLLKNRKLGYLGYEDSYAPTSLAKFMKESGFIGIESGIVPTGELFGTFYKSIPFVGKSIHKLLSKVAYFIESKQSTLGFISYAVGYKRE